MEVYRELNCVITVSQKAIPLLATKYLFTDKTWLLALHKECVMKQFSKADFSDVTTYELSNKRCILVNDFVLAIKDSYPDVYADLTGIVVESTSLLYGCVEVQYYNDGTQAITIAQALKLLNVNELRLDLIDFGLELVDDELEEVAVLRLSTFKKLVKRSRKAQSTLARLNAPSNGFA